MKNQGIRSHSFWKLEQYEAFDVKENKWCEGMVTANSHVGAILSCAPYNESITYQNMDFIMPTPELREVPKEVAQQLDEAKQAVLALDDSWDVHGRVRSCLYPFRPGARLRITQPEKKLCRYERRTGYARAEVVTSMKII